MIAARVLASLRCRTRTQLGRLIVPLVAARSLLALWRFRAELRKAFLVCVYEEGGFGHQITAPDIMRRLWPWRATALILFSDANPCLPLLFEHPRVLSLSMKLGGVQVSNKFQLALARFIRWLLRDGYTRVLSAGGLRRKLRGFLDPQNIAVSVPTEVPHCPYLPTYFHLLRQRPMELVRLPEAQRNEIEKVLWYQRGQKLCCIYLRNRADPAFETAARNGSPLRAYRAAIEYLSIAGYWCLLIGDRCHEDRHRAIDAASLGVDKRLFALFAATEADIFIGEAGGGSLMPGINGIPTLLLNTFPREHVFHRATAVFKPAADRPLDEIQILAAVRDFEQNHRRDVPYGLPAEGLGAGSWFPDADARVSPVNGG